MDSASKRRGDETADDWRLLVLLVYAAGWCMRHRASVTIVSPAPPLYHTATAAAELWPNSTMPTCPWRPRQTRDVPLSPNSIAPTSPNGEVSGKSAQWNLGFTLSICFILIAGLSADARITDGYWLRVGWCPAAAAAAALLVLQYRRRTRPSPLLLAVDGHGDCVMTVYSYSTHAVVGSGRSALLWSRQLLLSEIVDYSVREKVLSYARLHLSMRCELFRTL